jgi:hypothetical protein
VPGVVAMHGRGAAQVQRGPPPPRQTRAPAVAEAGAVERWGGSRGRGGGGGGESIPGVCVDPHSGVWEARDGGEHAWRVHKLRGRRFKAGEVIDAGGAHTNYPDTNILSSFPLHQQLDHLFPLHPA